MSYILYPGNLKEELDAIELSIVKDAVNGLKTQVDLSRKNGKKETREKLNLTNYIKIVSDV